MSSQALTDEQTPGHQPHAEGGEHGAHPTDAFYIKVALVLAVITAIEVSISYIKGLESVGNPLLLILAVIKFTGVAMFFMHLRFDNRVLRYLFITGIVLALFLYIVVLFMFHALP